MTLKPHILRRIAQQGPISLADYMADCLLHPVHGYYTSHAPFGIEGDFITAPEISQMFGELIGLCLAQAWLDQGSAPRITLAELGPGRGTLMQDALRATAQVPGFHEAARIVLVEASPRLRAVQAETLGDVPQWVDDVAELPDQPLFLIANEFFDALPIRQFQRASHGWQERRIGQSGEQLQIGLAGEAPQPALTHRLEDTKPGDLVEICPAAGPIMTHIATLIARQGGAGLIVDYGDWRSLGDTLQALRDHAPCDPLDAPGQADLTAHVDFEPLATAAHAAGCTHSKLTPQGVFLERLGITQRAQTLARHAQGEALENLIGAHRRLTHPQEMGNLFKVLGLTPAQAPALTGLDP